MGRAAGQRELDEDSARTPVGRAFGKPGGRYWHDDGIGGCVEKDLGELRAALRKACAHWAVCGGGRCAQRWERDGLDAFLASSGIARADCEYAECTDGKSCRSMAGTLGSVRTDDFRRRWRGRRCCHPFEVNRKAGAGAV